MTISSLLDSLNDANRSAMMELVMATAATTISHQPTTTLTSSVSPGAQMCDTTTTTGATLPPATDTSTVISNCQPEQLPLLFCQKKSCINVRIHPDVTARKQTSLPLCPSDVLAANDGQKKEKLLCSRCFQNCNTEYYKVVSVCIEERGEDCTEKIRRK